MRMRAFAAPCPLKVQISINNKVCLKRSSWELVEDPGGGGAGVVLGGAAPARHHSESEAHQGLTHTHTHTHRLNVKIQQTE